MRSDQDFELIARGYSLVTVNVIYYMPDHRSLLNEFMWQTLDLKPKYPRIKSFLEHWHREIDAIIKEVMIADTSLFDQRRFKHLDDLFKLN